MPSQTLLAASKHWKTSCFRCSTLKKPAMRQIGVFLRSSDAKCLRFGLPLRFGLRCEHPRCQIASDMGRAMRTTELHTVSRQFLTRNYCEPSLQHSFRERPRGWKTAKNPSQKRFWIPHLRYVSPPPFGDSLSFP